MRKALQLLDDNLCTRPGDTHLILRDDFDRVPARLEFPDVHGWDSFVRPTVSGCLIAREAGHVGGKLEDDAAGCVGLEELDVRAVHWEVDV